MKETRIVISEQQFELWWKVYLEKLEEHMKVRMEMIIRDGKDSDSGHGLIEHSQRIMLTS